MSNWIKCSERMPDIGEDVLLWRNLDYVHIGCMTFYRSGYSWSVAGFGNGTELKYFTHWMPLPEPPSEEE